MNRLIYLTLPNLREKHLFSSVASIQIYWGGGDILFGGKLHRITHISCSRTRAGNGSLELTHDPLTHLICDP